ncbi:MAG: M48 family metallopeptidase [Gallionellaceae bacterium]|jgi:predicted metal-dependent hydrolase|nr:M48 family metallopeptidase [Gallionellaceae bacterium]
MKLGVFDFPLEPPATERRTVMLSGKLLTYTLKRTHRRRSIGLRIDDDGLTVAVPLRASEKWLREVLQERARWIVDKLENWQTDKPAPTQWVDGQFIKFIGEPLTLRVVSSLFDAAPLLQGRQLYVHVSDARDQAAIAAAVEQWYRQQADALFRERIAHFSAVMGVAPSGVKLSAARTQWGCCTARGRVLLNWQLIKMSPRLIDYVVVHELAHLVEMNHSAAFWRVVGAACPDYARRRAELRRCRT